MLNVKIVSRSNGLPFSDLVSSINCSHLALNSFNYLYKTDFGYIYCAYVDLFQRSKK